MIGNIPVNAQESTIKSEVQQDIEIATPDSSEKNPGNSNVPNESDVTNDIDESATDEADSQNSNASTSKTVKTYASPSINEREQSVVIADIGTIIESIRSADSSKSDKLSVTNRLIDKFYDMTSVNTRLTWYDTSSKGLTPWNGEATPLANLKNLPAEVIWLAMPAN